MSDSIQITEDVFDTIPDPKFPNDTTKTIPIRRFTLVNRTGIKVQIINYGAAIVSLVVPDIHQDMKDIVLGFDNIYGYWQQDNPYFGAGIGRCANRIANGTFTLNGKTYTLSLNDGGGKHHLHGGVRGFDKHIWEGVSDKTSVTLTYVSPDGEQGYPGEVTASIRYELTDDNEIKVQYRATTTQSTPVSLTNHSYFNLAGHEFADQKLSEHFLSINADQYTPVDSELIPTGEIANVEGTIYDIRETKNLSDLFEQFPPGKNGYDHNWCINQTPGQDMNLAVRVSNEVTKLVLEVYTDQPGLQFYSGNFLPDPDNPAEVPLLGKGGANYAFHGAFCVETQLYPNGINLPQFQPSPVLNPGETYTHDTIFRIFVSPN